MASAVAEAETALKMAEAKLANLLAARARSAVARDSCDILLKKWSELVDTESIVPVHGAGATVRAEHFKKKYSFASTQRVRRVSRHVTWLTS